jgi:hypothetical protein
MRFFLSFLLAVSGSSAMAQDTRPDTLPGPISISAKMVTGTYGYRHGWAGDDKGMGAGELKIRIRRNGFFRMYVLSKYRSGSISEKKEYLCSGKWEIKGDTLYASTVVRKNDAFSEGRNQQLVKIIFISRDLIHIVSPEDVPVTSCREEKGYCCQGRRK